MTRDRAGFTLVELMIVVVVIGVLAAVAIPNFVLMQRTSREASVKANMHTIQVALEDFSVQNDSYYPNDATSTLPDGRDLEDLCPGGVFPKNPFTSLATVVQFDANPTPGAKGELAINPADVTRYVIKGNGLDGDTLSLHLTSGQ